MNAEASEVAQETARAPKKSKTDVVKVKMTDGREVEFAGKRKLVKDYTLEDDGSLAYITLDFRNGDTRQIRLPAALVGQFAGHGAIQKYGDNLAGLKPAEGQDEVDIEDMVYETDLLDERIQKGEWSAEREGGGIGGTSILIKALMEYSSQPVEQVKGFLKDKDQKFKMSLRGNDKRRNAAGVTLKAIVDRLEAEKAAKATKVDTDSALAELDGLGAAA